MATWVHSTGQNQRSVLGQDLKIVRMLLTVVRVFLFCWLLVSITHFLRTIQILLMIGSGEVGGHFAYISFMQSNNLCMSGPNLQSSQTCFRK